MQHVVSFFKRDRVKIWISRKQITCDLLLDFLSIAHNSEHSAEVVRLKINVSQAAANYGFFKQTLEQSSIFF